MPATLPPAQQLADAIWAEIQMDAKAGLFTGPVNSFGSLHDFVDANLYGDTENLMPSNEAEMDGFVSLLNAAQGIVDARLKASPIGGVVCES